jgi:hypothetical protein
MKVSAPPHLLPEVGPELVRALEAVELVTLSEEQRVQARDLLGHLLELDGLRRLTPPFFKLALNAIEGNKALSSWIDPLARIADRHCDGAERQAAGRVEPVSWPAWADSLPVRDEPSMLTSVGAPASYRFLSPVDNSPGHAPVRTGV